MTKKLSQNCIGATVDGTTGVRMRVVALRGSSTPFCRSESETARHLE